MAAIKILMSEFNAEAFLAKLNRGDFDGHIHDEFEKLSSEQLEQVALLALKQGGPLPFARKAACHSIPPVQQEENSPEGGNDLSVEGAAGNS